MSNRLFETDLASDLEFLTARARAVGSVRANARLEPLNLKVRSYAVLVLACSDINPSQRELADFLSLDASQIVALVDGLEERGLVIRESDPRDRRSNVIKPTASGRDLAGKATEQVRIAEDESLKALTSSERELLRDFLSRIAFDAE